jgi:isoquinoline 1-oxidoreductase beta subunit
MDVRVPGMVYAVVLRSPRFGGKLTSFDAAGAANVPGFIDAKALLTETGVAVYAKNTWAAIQSREAISAAWDFSNAENRSTDALIAYHRELVAIDPRFPANKAADLPATKARLSDADTVVEAEYSIPMLAHAPMEPLNCVIEPTEKGVRIHDGCQSPGAVKPTVAYVLGIDAENVEIKTVYAGGPSDVAPALCRTTRRKPPSSLRRSVASRRSKLCGRAKTTFAADFIGQWLCIRPRSGSRTEKLSLRIIEWQPSPL